MIIVVPLMVLGTAMFVAMLMFVPYWPYYIGIILVWYLVARLSDYGRKKRHAELIAERMRRQRQQWMAADRRKEPRRERSKGIGMAAMDVVKVVTGAVRPSLLVVDFAMSIREVEVTTPSYSHEYRHTYADGSGKTGVRSVGSGVLRFKRD